MGAGRDPHHPAGCEGGEANFEASMADDCVEDSEGSCSALPQSRLQRLTLFRDGPALKKSTGKSLKVPLLRTKSPSPKPTLIKPILPLFKNGFQVTASTSFSTLKAIQSPLWRTSSLRMRPKDSDDSDSHTSHTPRLTKSLGTHSPLPREQMPVP